LKSLNDWPYKNLQVLRFNCKNSLKSIVLLPNFTDLFAAIVLKKGLYLCNRSRERFLEKKVAGLEFWERPGKGNFDAGY
jgi:hypothetical protein